MAEEGTHLSQDSVNEGMGKGEHDDEVGENEEFYETIEAPKFVDFTVPDHRRRRPDDRYWFCLRVGCDQKHEEEMDSEAIYKNFVLRVMAARSPNVRLHKALNRNCSSKNMKCPLSAPPKSSKSRLPRLAIISSISQKMDDNKGRAKPLSKVSSTTPKAKGKQVAAKYLTTPSGKTCIAKPNGFRSVQNTKPPSVVAPKSRTVVKTLSFQSPKKTFSLKTSVELRTPVTKLCEKMKKLEITSQRKAALAHPSKQSKELRHHSQKAMPVCSSARPKSSNNDKCRGKISQKLIARQSTQDAKSLRFEGKKMGKLSKQSSIKEISCANKTKAQSRDEDHCSRDHPVKEVTTCPTVDGPSSDASKGELNSSSNPPQGNVAGDDILTAQASTKEDMEIQQKIEESIGVPKVTFGSQQNSDKVLSEYAISLGKGCESKTTHNDDKENASALNENRSCSHKNDHSGKSILGLQNSDRRKVVEAVDKDCKGQATNGAPGAKLMKLKPTNPKPFKLRTDERRILREANLERKNHAVNPPKEAAVGSRFQGRDLCGQHVDTQKGMASLKPTKQQVKAKTPTAHKVHQSKQQELKPTTPTCESNSKKKISSSVHVLDQPQRHLYVTPESMTPENTLNETVNTTSGNSKPKEMRMQQGMKLSRVPDNSPGSVSQGRTVTIPKEPNFQKSCMLKSCSVKIS